jgi:hypothetical protein
MDMMNRVYGELIGRWLGKYISVDVDEEVMAWGEELRIRVAVRVDQPLPRGVPLKESDDDEESKWFDLKYEKIPHFCFDCGCLIHASGVCAAGSEALDNGIKQWGEWLRASPKKSIKPPSKLDLLGQAVSEADLLMASLRLGVVHMSRIFHQGETLPMLMIVRVRLALASMNQGREGRRFQARIKETDQRPLSVRSRAVLTPRGSWPINGTLVPM